MGIFSHNKIEEEVWSMLKTDQGRIVHLVYFINNTQVSHTLRLKWKKNFNRNLS